MDGDGGGGVGQSLEGGPSGGVAAVVEVAPVGAAFGADYGFGD